MTASTGGVAAGSGSADPVAEHVLRFLAERTKTEYAPDEDLFASGGISSLFALELVLHLEDAFGVTVTGPDLTLDNFRTVRAMAALVGRLTAADGSAA
jgi:methoxymalonate biosynthesis acyl carrier protein